MEIPTTLSPFHIKDCTLAAIATGIKAQTLLELRDHLFSIPVSSIYYHFWGGRLRTSFEHREYHNDFAFWAHHNLRDDILAERLELLNPTEFPSMEELRQELIEIVENRLDEREFVPWAKLEAPFHFIRSTIVVFHTRHLIQHPQELPLLIPRLSKSSLFYHFIDSARRMPSKTDDFTNWLSEEEERYQLLITAIRKLDPYLISLADLQKKLTDLTTRYFGEGLL